MYVTYDKLKALLMLGEIKMKKHAYLIMAHNEFDLLKQNIELLDDDRSDIYLHVDKKARNFPIEELRSIPQKSNLYIIERQNVSWGGDSQIKCELSLLREAIKKHYIYYHLISGVDMPIKTQDSINKFFDENNGKEFIHFDTNMLENNPREVEKRIRYYYPLQNKIGRNTGKFILCLNYIQQEIIKIQSLLNIDRRKQYNMPIYKGTNWFSITDGMANYLVDRSEFIIKYFGKSFCADEVFLHTMAMNSPFRDNIVDASLREIDWKRGFPYTYRIEDFDLLMKSNNLFARKFSEKVDTEVIEKIYRKLLKENS